MIKNTLIALLVYLALYYLKVPVVVTFTNQLLATVIPSWDSVIDSWIHLMERHPYIYMALPVILFYFMLPKRSVEYFRMIIVKEDD